MKYLKISMAAAAAVLAGLLASCSGGAPEPLAAAPETEVVIIRPKDAPGYEKKLLAALRKAGLEVSVIDWEALAQSGNLNPGTVRLAIFPGAREIPAGYESVLSGFMEGGGGVIALGAPAFDSVLYPSGGDWKTLGELALSIVEDENSRVYFNGFADASDIDGWQRNANDTDTATVLRVEDSGDGAGSVLCLDIKDFTGWDNFTAPFFLSGDHELIALKARATDRVSSFSVELKEEDGSRWIAVCPVSADWESHILQREDFAYWHDSASSGRGFEGDTVNFANTRSISVGIAASHNPIPSGDHSLWIDSIVSSDFAIGAAGSFALDGLAPEYKYYPVTNAASLRTFENQVIIPDLEYTLPDSAASVSPRPQGTGIDKNRSRRFIPLIEMMDEKDIRSGLLAWMVCNISPGADNFATDFEGSMVAVFGTDDEKFYDENGLAAVAAAAERMVSGNVLIEAGADEYRYLEDDPSWKLGASAFCRDGGDGLRAVLTLKEGERVLYSVEKTLDGSQTPLVTDMGSYFAFSEEYVSATPSATVVTELFDGETLIDRIAHDIDTWQAKPESERRFITWADNEFYLDGSPIRFYGVNYMPSSGIAVDADMWQYFEQYVSGESYDPDVFRKDLERVKEIGFNAVSLFVYYDAAMDTNNMVDLIAICEELGLYVDLSLRPHANPLEFDGELVTEMVLKNRFHENDNIIAFDMAWERAWGSYEPHYSNALGRKGYNKDWENWLINRYGSVENAELQLGHEIPRDNGEIAAVSDGMLRESGPWDALVAAYRLFVDDFVGAKTYEAAEALRAAAPNHLVSQRAGGDSSIPLADPAAFGIDFRAWWAHDFMSPESYALRNNEESMRQGLFTNIYARYAKPGAPVVWKEYGLHVWTGSNFTDKSAALQSQADYYRLFLDMIIRGHSGGAYCWWYPGGFRTNENSDFGIVNPDGSDRPVTKVLREYAEKFLNQGALSDPEVVITIDRELYANGFAGIYESVKDELFAALGAGKTVAFADPGTGATSEDFELIGVGNTEYSEKNLPKNINGYISSVEVYEDGDWKKVERGGTVAPGSRLRFGLVNTGSVTWLAPSGGIEKGRVALASVPGSRVAAKAFIAGDMGYLSAGHIELTLPRGKTGALALRLYSWDRAGFGEVIRLTVE